MVSRGNVTFPATIWSAKRGRGKLTRATASRPGFPKLTSSHVEAIVVLSNAPNLRYGNDGHVTVGARGRFSECLEASIAIDRQVDVRSGVFATGENRMTLSPDYYAVLGVPSTASRDTIHSAWKALLRQYHPMPIMAWTSLLARKRSTRRMPFWARRTLAPPTTAHGLGHHLIRLAQIARSSPGRPAGDRCDQVRPCSPVAATRNRWRPADG